MNLPTVCPICHEYINQEIDPGWCGTCQKHVMDLYFHNGRVFDIAKCCINCEHRMGIKRKYVACELDGEIYLGRSICSMYKASTNKKTWTTERKYLPERDKFDFVEDYLEQVVKKKIIRKEYDDEGDYF